jgi:GTPase SAR1 family protein
MSYKTDGTYSIVNKERKCLFCFKHFNSDLVHFRSASIAEDLCNDDIYDNYLKAFNNKIKYYSYQYLKAIIPENEDQKIYKDGVLVGYMEDNGAKTFQSICPFCHNDILDKGDSDIKIIALLGESGTGKTSYLISLVHQLLNEVSIRINAVFIPDTKVYSAFRKEFEEPFISRCQFPGSNDTDRLVQPFVIYGIKYRGRGNSVESKFTLVFYDLAGKALSDSNYVDKYGRHISNADFAMEFVEADACLSSDLKIRESARISFIRDVTILKENIADRNTIRKSNIPVALIITKCDKIICDYHIRNCAVIYDAYAEYYNVLSLYFKTARLFLTSSVGLDCLNRKQPKPYRVEEPILWLLERNGLLEYDINGRTGGVKYKS